MAKKKTVKQQRLIDCFAGDIRGPVKSLTERQHRYVDCFDGNIKRSALAAGISYIYAKELHTKTYYAHVQTALTERREAVSREDIATREERQKFWTSVERDKSLNMSDRLRASELLGKSEADFIDVVKSDSIMRLQLGAPRALIAGQTPVDAEFEPARLERSTELDHETV